MNRANPAVLETTSSEARHTTNAPRAFALGAYRSNSIFVEACSELLGVEDLFRVEQRVVDEELNEIPAGGCLTTARRNMPIPIRYIPSARQRDVCYRRMIRGRV